MTSDEFEGTTNHRGDANSPIVRPLNYVADQPVARRIGDRALYVGNWRAADPEQHDQSFDYVLSVSSDEYPLTTHHYPLDDGSDNEWIEFERAIETARELYASDGSLLVHCNAGISRSPTVVATTLAAEEDRHFQDALALVQEARPPAIPNPALHELAVVYVADRT